MKTQEQLSAWRYGQIERAKELRTLIQRNAAYASDGVAFLLERCIEVDRMSEEKYRETLATQAKPSYDIPRPYDIPRQSYGRRATWSELAASNDRLQDNISYQVAQLNAAHQSNKQLENNLKATGDALEKALKERDESRRDLTLAYMERDEAREAFREANQSAASATAQLIAYTHSGAQTETDKKLEATRRELAVALKDRDDARYARDRAKNEENALALLNASLRSRLANVKKEVGE